MRIANIALLQEAARKQPPIHAGTTRIWRQVNFMGGYIMSLCIAFTLYGMTTAQAYIFMLNSKKDSTFLKTVVATVWFLETIHTVFMLRQIYYLTIVGFGDIAIITTVDWSIGVFLVAEDCIIAIVQGFYIRRIWILCGKRVLPTIGLVLLLLACVGFHMTAAAFTFVADTWVDFQTLFGATLCVEVSNALSAALDGIIAAVMIFILNKSMTGFKRTDSILRWLMAYSVNTGLLTMIVSVSIAIVYSRDRESLIASGLTTISGKLYANSFLGLLNARDLMRSKGQQSTTTPVLDTSSFELSNYRGSSGRVTQGSAPQHIAFAHSAEYSTKSNMVDSEETETKVIDIVPDAQNVGEV
ncbi:unnamed protein product [Somion occarium]|uniref:DUF6534 domain-containing protein n=1 Tax=Somion occarium TaxID=3059160 RepID=A0ABP1D6Y8_9APHY